MNITKPVRGRPKLNTNKPARIKITIDLAPETHALLTQIRSREGRSFGRCIDAAISNAEKS